MGVHDEETRRYFKNSAVRCVLAPRYADHKLSWFRQQVLFNFPYMHYFDYILLLIVLFKST